MGGSRVNPPTLPSQPKIKITFTFKLNPNLFTLLGYPGPRVILGDLVQPSKSSGRETRRWRSWPRRTRSTVILLSICWSATARSACSSVCVAYPRATSAAKRARTWLQFHSPARSAFLKQSVELVGFRAGLKYKLDFFDFLIGQDR